MFCLKTEKIARAIAQALHIAYQQLLPSYIIAHEHVKEVKYCHAPESQKHVEQDLDKLTDQQSTKIVSSFLFVISKKFMMVLK